MDRRRNAGTSHRGGAVPTRGHTARARFAPTPSRYGRRLGRQWSPCGESVRTRLHRELPTSGVFFRTYPRGRRDRFDWGDASDKSRAIYEWPLRLRRIRQ